MKTTVEEDNEMRLMDGDPGEQGFTGVNELLPPAQLALGELAWARNCRMTLGEVEPRLGVAKLRWTNKTGSGLTTPQPFNGVLTFEVFKDALGLEWLVIAAEGRVYRTRSGNGVGEIPIPAGTVIPDEVSFTQTVNGLVMFRGDDLPQLIMESLDVGFKTIAQADNTISGDTTENPEDGTEQIPPARSGEWIGNRLYMLFRIQTPGAEQKDLLAVSDYLNATRYVETRSQGRINQGSSDEGVRFFKFSATTGIAFKSASIYAVYGLKGDLSAMELDGITDEMGLAAAEAVVAVGRENADEPEGIWFLAQKLGIMAIIVTDQGKLGVRAVPVSREMAQTIGRIDWRNAGASVGMQWNNKVYWAVPLDDSKGYGPELIRNGAAYSGGPAVSYSVIAGARYRWVRGANDTSLVNGTTTLADSSEFTAETTFIQVNGESGAVTASLKRLYENVNNAVLVFDRLKGKWAGYDTGSGFLVKKFRKAEYNGVERLLALTADGFVNVLEELFYDEVAYEHLGANAATGYQAAAGVVTVVKGREYSCLFGSNDLQLTNGTEVLVKPSGAVTWADSFVAQDTTVTIAFTAGPALASVKIVDWILDTEYVDNEFKGRGMKCGIAQRRKRFVDWGLDLRTWFAKYSLSVLVEGVSEEVTVFTDRTKSATAYYKPARKAAWNRTNVDDDHATEHRQGYEVVLGETTTPSGSIAAGLVYFVEDLTGAASIRYNGVVIDAPATFTGVAGVAVFTVLSGTPLVYGPGTYVYFGENGIEPDQHQVTSESGRLPMRCRGTAMQYHFRNTQGRAVVANTFVDAVLIDRRKGIRS